MSRSGGFDRSSRLPATAGVEASPYEIVAIVGSAGAARALSTLVAALPRLPVPVVVLTHLGATMGEALARFLAQSASMPVSVWTGGRPLTPGCIWVGPGRRHLRFTGKGRLLVFDRLEGSPLAPSLDHFLGSVASTYGPAALAAILTGMGDDGARGLMKVRDAGGLTLGQDRESCLVFGMPRVASELGAVARQQPPAKMAVTMAWALGRGGPPDPAEKGR